MGLPGAGKTSLCSGLVQRFKGKQSVLTTEKAITLCIKRRDSGRIKNIVKRFPTAFREPLIGASTALPEYHIFTSDHVGLWHHVFEVLDRGDFSTETHRLVTYAFIQQGVQYQLLKTHLHSSECVFIEEGFGQRGFTLFGYLPEENRIKGDEERYVGNIPLPDLLIWIVADPANAAARVFQRAELPVLLNKMSKDKVLLQMNWGAECLKNIAYYMSKKNTHILEISNNDGEFENALNIATREVVKILFPK